MLVFSVVTLLAFGLAGGCGLQAATPKRSGVYLSAADYQNGRLSYEGDCKSQAHRLEIHDIRDKPYIDVTHGSVKTRFQKSDLFGFRACDGHDYRFDSKLEYLILESKDLYIYSRKRYVNYDKIRSTFTDYYFSVGLNGPILALTIEKLKEAFPENHKFHDLLDANFSAGQKVEEYDDFHKMFKVNRLLIASREG